MLNLTLVTPERRLVANQEVEEVFVPGWRGELNILPGHEPLLTILHPGILKYRNKGQTELTRVAVSGGYCQVSPQGVMVLAENAERPDELDVTRAQTSLREAETCLLNEVMNEEELQKVQDKAARARARLELVQ